MQPNSQNMDMAFGFANPLLFVLQIFIFSSLSAWVDMAFYSAISFCLFLLLCVFVCLGVKHLL